MSSHLAELIPRLERVPEVELRHFDLAVEDGTPRYPYRLEPGPYAGRMAMALLRSEGLLDSLGALPARV